MAAWEWRRSYDNYVKCDICIFYIPCIFIYMCCFIYNMPKIIQQKEQASRKNYHKFPSHLCWT